MTSRDPSATPHKRGVEHLKRAEYAQAAAAFTEAIELEPDAPNAYAGRALAFRSLGDEVQAARDEQTVRDFGGTEATPYERFVRKAWRRWKADLSDPNWRKADPLSRQAVLLWVLNGQILNGGLSQWIANGYGEWADEVTESAREIGTAAASEVAAMLKDLSRDLAAGLAEELQPGEALEEEDRLALVADSTDEGLEEEDETFNRLSIYEDRYYRVRYQFMLDFEAWLDRRAGALP